MALFFDFGERAFDLANLVRGDESRSAELGGVEAGVKNEERGSRSESEPELVPEAKPEPELDS